MKATREVQERPLVADAKTARKIAAGWKTQMRKPIQWRPIEDGLNLAFSGLDAGLYNTVNPDSGWVLRSRSGHGTWNDRTKPVLCPFGSVRDRLWIQETHRFLGSSDEFEEVEYQADGMKWGFKTDDLVIHSSEWLAAEDMPRWATRTVLEVEKIGIERLHGISDEDIVAEGAACEHCDGRGWYLKRFADNHGTPCKYCIESAAKLGVKVGPGQVATQNLRNTFATSWDSRYAKRAGWDKNPWVWVVTWKAAKA